MHAVLSLTSAAYNVKLPKSAFSHYDPVTRTLRPAASAARKKKNTDAASANRASAGTDSVKTTAATYAATRRSVSSSSTRHARDVARDPAVAAIRASALELANSTTMAAVSMLNDAPTAAFSSAMRFLASLAHETTHAIAIESWRAALKYCHQMVVGLEEMHALPAARPVDVEMLQVLHICACDIHRKITDALDCLNATANATANAQKRTKRSRVADDFLV